MNTPTLSLVVRTPIRLIASIGVSDDTATQATWQISTVSNFASTVVDTTATSAWATIEYAIPAGQETTTYYVRAKVSDGTTESSWSTTLTVAAAPTPSTPTIAQLGATPQRIGVYVSNLTSDDASVFQYQFSKSSSFATIAETMTGGTRAEYLVPTADRQTTHYIRARAGNLQDVAGGGAEVYSWSSWSSTLTVANAGRIESDDITELAFSKVKRAVTTGGGDWINVGDLEAFLNKWQIGDPTGAYSGYIRSSYLFGGGGYLSVAKSAQSVGTTTLTNSTALQFSASSGTAYRFSLHAVLAWDGASDVKFALSLPSLDGGLLNLAYISTTNTTSATLPAPTSYRAGNNFGTITETGASGTRFTHITIEGLLLIPVSGGGTVAFQFAANTNPGGIWVTPSLEVGSYIQWQELTL